MTPHFTTDRAGVTRKARAIDAFTRRHVPEPSLASAPAVIGITRYWRRDEPQPLPAFIIAAVAK